jgi:hypothetical protein
MFAGNHIATSAVFLWYLEKIKITAAKRTTKK